MAKNFFAGCCGAPLSQGTALRQDRCSGEKLDGENKRGFRILDLILGGPFPGRRRRFRKPIAQHCGTKQKAPGLRRGLLLIQQCSAYRLTWRLVPPPGAPLPLSPLETTLTQSASLSL